MNYKNQIIEMIMSMSGHVSAYNIFCDWVEMSALSIQNACFMNHNELWLKREERYKAIISNYSLEEQRKFTEMFELLSESFDDNIEDLLGEIYMRSESGNKFTGQFFTPFHISVVTAELGISKDYDGSDVLTFSEPSCGSGKMIIASAAVLKSRGFDYKKKMKVVCQDLDWKCVYMTYVQLSLLGIDAIVAQGDTLCKPYTKGHPEKLVFRTPVNMGMIL